MVGGGDPFYLKFWVNRSQLELPLANRSAACISFDKNISANSMHLTSNVDK